MGKDGVAFRLRWLEAWLWEGRVPCAHGQIPMIVEGNRQWGRRYSENAVGVGILLSSFVPVCDGVVWLAIHNRLSRHGYGSDA